MTGGWGCSTAEERVFTRLLAGISSGKSGSPSTFAAMISFSGSGVDKSSPLLKPVDASNSNSGWFNSGN